MTTISAGAFRGCEGLLYVRIPSSVTSIAADAFDGCRHLLIFADEYSKGWSHAIQNMIPIRIP